MKTIVLNVEQLGSALEAHMQHLIGDLTEAAILVCHQGVAEARRITVAENIPDTGEYLAAWRLVHTQVGPTVQNESPHSVYVENGRRPGAPGPPIQPIAEWATRKLGIGNPGRTKRGPLRAGQRRGGRVAVYSGAAWVIRNNIHKFGIRPKFVMLRTFQYMQPLWRDEIRQVLATSTP